MTESCSNTKQRGLEAQFAAIDRSLARVEFDVQGTVIDANQNFLDLMRYEREELIGRHHKIFVPEDQQESQQYLEFWRTLRSGAFHRGEFLRVARDGRERWIQATYNPVFAEDGAIEKIVKYATDISVQKEAEQIADSMWTLLNAQLTAIDRSQARVEFDHSGTVIDANKNFLEIMGYDAEEVLGQHHRMFVPQKTASSQSYAEFWRLLQSGAFHRGEFMRLAKDGSERWIQATYSPVLAEDGSIEKIVKYATDVTAQKKLEADLFRARKLESIGQLSAGVAHEINTPLQCVVNNIDFLESAQARVDGVIRSLLELLDREEKEWADRVEEARRLVEDSRFRKITHEQPLAIADSASAAHRVTDIVRAMKSLSHPGSDEKSSFDLNEAVRSAVTITRNRWKQSAELDLQLDDRITEFCGRSTEISQVAINLIVNAADAIAEHRRQESGVGRIVVRTVLEPEGSVRLEVQDNGPGMPPEVLGRVFDPFFTTKEVGKGTGQGLALTYDIVVGRHGGTIEAFSEPGEGAKFVVCLPVDHALEHQADRSHQGEDRKHQELSVAQ